MHTSLKLAGLVALGLTIVPPALFVGGHIELPLVKWLMAGGCVLWFATAPFFLKGGAE